MTTIVIIIAVFILLWMFSKAAKNSKVDINLEGAYILRYSNTIKWTCMGIVILFFLFITALIIMNVIKINEEFSAVIAVYVGILLSGTYFYIELFTVKIFLSKKGIIGTSGWRGTREFSWEEIEKISFSTVSMWFKVSSKNCPPLRIHDLITGIDTFQKFYMEN